MADLVDLTINSTPNNNPPAANGMQEHGVYYLTGEVTSATVSPAIQFILNHSLSEVESHEYLTFIVNSPGGYCSEGFGLIDIMLGSSIPIHTVGLGEICSMGLLIFMAGQRGHRVLTPNCMILSHQWSGGTGGKAHELLAFTKCQDILSKMIMRHYKRMTVLSEKVINQKLLPPEDVWLTAQEAQKLHLCDKVIDIKPSHLKNKRSN